MLVLRRKPNESVILEIAGVRILITILDRHGDNQAIGIDAPQCVKIRRAELPAPPREDRQTAAFLADARTAARAANLIDQIATMRPLMDFPA